MRRWICRAAADDCVGLQIRRRPTESYGLPFLLFVIRAAKHQPKTPFQTLAPYGTPAITTTTRATTTTQAIRALALVLIPGTATQEMLRKQSTYLCKRISAGKETTFYRMRSGGWSICCCTWSSTRQSPTEILVGHLISFRYAEPYQSHRSVY